MDGVRPVQKWTDSAGQLHDSEADANQAQARIIVRNIVSAAINWTSRCIDVEALADRRNQLTDALTKIERGR
jgi:hypothetical protein